MAATHRDRLGEEERAERVKQRYIRYAQKHPGLAAKRAKEWHENNRERYNAGARERYARDMAAKSGPNYEAKLKKKEAAKKRAEAKAPPIGRLASIMKWREKNWDKYLSYHSIRNRHKNQAKPKWANDAEIAKFYSLSREKAAQTGMQHCVDHIIPLKHELVCGLHVETNLQVLTKSENCRKSNKFEIQEI